ncbi:hypothetical protein HanHA300_Chr16g0605581 [Helianthus annuus]|nr:hypothetical protein HanHA300_Chr16g0605581 [Helianthus annuus]KAJ0460052.1 hypothetical protein HanHA89_Chr16g0656131 [Helianthus annuus]KAJ0640498.1 hypothetical protein HanLR1_Chr16g0616181 [Helianthus annuus]
MADGCKVWHPHNTTSSSGGSEDKSVGKQVMCASDPSPPQQTMERKKTQVWDNRQLGLQSNPDTVWVLVHHDMGEVGVQVLDRCHLGAIKHRLGLVPLSADRLTYWPLWFSTRQLWFPQVLKHSKMTSQRRKILVEVQKKNRRNRSGGNQTKSFLLR